MAWYGIVLHCITLHTLHIFNVNKSTYTVRLTVYVCTYKLIEGLSPTITLWYSNVASEHPALLVVFSIAKFDYQRLNWGLGLYQNQDISIMKYIKTTTTTTTTKTTTTKTRTRTIVMERFLFPLTNPKRDFKQTRQLGRVPC